MKKELQFVYLNIYFYYSTGQNNCAKCENTLSYGYSFTQTSKVSASQSKESTNKLDDST